VFKKENIELSSGFTSEMSKPKPVASKALTGLSLENYLEISNKEWVTSGPTFSLLQRTNF